LAALILLTSMPVLAQAVDFKGIKLGDRLGVLQERDIFGALDCNPMQLSADDYQNYLLDMQSLVPGAQKVCVATASIATVPADVTVVLGMSRRVLRLTFQFAGSDYPRVLQAMGEKWGEGIHEVRGEADESVWWDFSDGSTISVHQSPAEDSPQHDVTTVGLAEYMLATTAPANDL
jgi:hypothetical protein